MAQINRGPIFIIEDDPADVEAISRVLVRRGHEFFEVFGDAEHARDALSSGPAPSLIFLDHGLPSTSGMELLAQLRAMPATAAIPVVLLSGLVDDICDAAWQNGASCVVRKPTDAEEFARVVDSICALYLDARVSSRKFDSTYGR